MVTPRHPPRVAPLLGVPLLLVVLAAPARAADPDVPPAARLTARSSLPPGESGFYPVAAQAQGKATGDYGPHTDDQRESYWAFQTKPAPFSGSAGEVGGGQTPAPGVRIHRDAAGVPSVYGDTGREVWFGAGYAAATDRLFELDGVRRTAEGRLAELTGPASVPSDLATRTIGYTDAEYAGMLAGLSQQGRDAIEGYAAGVQARILQVRADPTQLPAEYAVLQTLPADWTTQDTLASGTYITRFVATQGGNEFANVRTLRTLEQTYGTVDGRRAFQDLFSDEDPLATTTIDATVSNLPAADRTPAAREADFQRAADAADALPLELATGPGTGAAAAPSPLGSLPSWLPASLPASPSDTPLDTAAGAAGLPAPVAAGLRQAADALRAWSAHLHGGSFGFAISGRRTRDGHALLQSSPQLDYSYPGLLWELEVHGGGYDARGVSVPGIPTVGIGWTPSTAWALTTGYSKTIDSYVETTRPNPTAGGPPQWLHGGVWADESCRTEAIAYRNSVMGVPVGPAANTASYQVCRTGHGPVLATTADGSRARSVQYAQWLHDVDTVDGILTWDRATTLADIEAGVKKVAWNENIVAADADGHIGYWHPGRYPRRAPGLDQRFPTPGTGGSDSSGLLSYEEMPHVVDPPAGFVANWNTKPAHGWVDGDLSGTTTRPAGPANRLRVITSRLAARTDFTPADLPVLDTTIGSADMRAAAYRPVLALAGAATGVTGDQRSALELLAGWDGRAYAPGAPGGSSPTGTPAAAVTDGPAATLFAAFVARVRTQVYGGLPADVLTRLSTLPAESHQYDVVPVDNLVLRALTPSTSGIRSSRDWAGGRSTPAVVLAALDQALADVRGAYGADPATWRRAHAISHLDSLTGVVGPSAVMPFEDRGSWVHQIAFITGTPQPPLAAAGTATVPGAAAAAPGIVAPPLLGPPVVSAARAPAGRVPVARAAGAAGRGSLAATGGGGLPAYLGLGTVALAVLLSRGRRRRGVRGAAQPPHP